MSRTALAAALAGLLAAACSSSDVPPGELTCAPACTEWQSCAAGHCVLGAGRCTVNSDCPSDKPVCDVGFHQCVNDANCRACGEWETCVHSLCVANEDRCSTDHDCDSGVCDTDRHVCADAFCSPACAEWQTCTGHACSVTPGRCESDHDCGNRDTPSCEVKTHRCTAPVVPEDVSSPARGLIVTTRALQPYFERLARIHTLTGVPTRVVTTEDLCAGRCHDLDPRHDTAKAIKDYLLQQHGLEVVVLGGDIEDVPSRRIHDHFSNMAYGVDFDEDFYTDYYYADLGEWDTDHDGAYASDGHDKPDYLPELAVTRIPASSQWQVDTYIGKVLHHLTAYDLTQVDKALFLSNVATSVTVPLVDYTVPIDSALYFEAPHRTQDIVPPNVTRTKLYTALPLSGVTKLTVPVERQEIQKGPNFIIHAGHGWEDGLTVEIDGQNEFSGADAWNLQNTNYPFFLSGACLAGTFAISDSAGEKLVLAPHGGAVGYLGNGATGLGLAGGAQFVDEFLRYAFSYDRPLVGQALRAAHQNLPTRDGITIPIPNYGDLPIDTVDQDSYEWTQKSVTFLGDGLLPIYTDASMLPAPAIALEKRPYGSYSKLVFHVSTVLQGTIEVQVGAHQYELPVTGSELTLVVRGDPAKVSWGFFSDRALSAYEDVTF